MRLNDIFDFRHHKGLRILPTIFSGKGSLKGQGQIYAIKFYIIYCIKGIEILFYVSKNAGARSSVG